MGLKTGDLQNTNGKENLDKLHFIEKKSFFIFIFVLTKTMCCRLIECQGSYTLFQSP